jgi:hypothetical protein
MKMNLPRGHRTIQTALRSGVYNVEIDTRDQIEIWTTPARSASVTSSPARNASHSWWMGIGLEGRGAHDRSVVRPGQRRTARLSREHGNPNVVTVDRGTSQLAQLTMVQTVLVQVKKCHEPPPVSAFDPPRFADR